jgi:hypothetical protein
MTMKKLLYPILMVLFATMMGSCAKANSESAGGKINPGDKVGNFLITTGDSEGVAYVWNLESKCVKQEGGKIQTCKINIDTKVNVSWGVYAPTGYDLDTLWSEHTYKMYIDDHPVNLEAFGPIDAVHPLLGKMRYWNVVIVANKPGEIIVRSEGVVGGDPFGDTKTFTFGTP